MADNFGDRLYVGGFSASLSSEQIRTLISQSAAPFEVGIEIVENGSRKHRGFAFVQCKTPNEANVLLNRFTSLFSKVNFAKKEPKPAETVMSNISNVFIRGISRDMTDTELYEAFGGVAEGVVQCHVADGYGFVLFDTRENAQKKITEMDGKVLNGKSISVTWARPDTVGRKRKRVEETPSLIATTPDVTNLSGFLKRPLLTSQLFPSQTPLLPSPLFPLLPTPNFPVLYQNPFLMGVPNQTDLSQYLNFLV